MSKKRVVLIAGVHGVSGAAAAEHWSAMPDTEVYGLSRRSSPAPAGVHAISVDLLKADDVHLRLSSLRGINSHRLRRIHRKAERRRKICGQRRYFAKSPR